MGDSQEIRTDNSLTTLGNLCQHLIYLTVKKHFLYVYTPLYPQIDLFPSPAYTWEDHEQESRMSLYKYPF